MNWFSSLRKYLLPIFSIGAILLFLLSNIFQPNFWSIKNVYATATYSNGYYTKLCGDNAKPDGDINGVDGPYNANGGCPAKCDTGGGFCDSTGFSGNTVVRYTCDGKTTNCTSGESSFSTRQDLDRSLCGKTQQIDVFDHNCRENGGWSCGIPKGFIVWYSGDCATPAPPPSQPSCSYNSTQARVQRNLSDPWDTSKTINLGDQIRVGGFHDGTGVLASDVNLSVGGFGNVGNGAFITPTQPGTYTLTVTTQGQPDVPACRDTASFVVQSNVVPPPPPPPVPPPPPPAPPPQGGLQCPAGTVAEMRDNTLVCVQTIVTNTNTNTSSSTSSSSNTNNITFGNVGTGTSQPVVVQPQVAGVAVSTLPKTGLPAIAWSALAFIPVGFRMRRFKEVKKDLEDDPQFIWEERQFKSGA